MNFKIQGAVSTVNNKKLTLESNSPNFYNQHASLVPYSMKIAEPKQRK